MDNANLVASELNSIGFVTSIVGNTVNVSLDNRKPSWMEIETALEQLFDGIEFEVKSVTFSVLVTTL